MIRNIDPRYFILIGFILLLLGFILPMLMILQVIESTYFLNFFAYGCQVLGMLLGIAGIAYLSVQARRKK
jgi:hypothetical protein